MCCKRSWRDVRLAERGKTASIVAASTWGRGESGRVIVSNRERLSRYQAACHHRRGYKQR